MHGAHLAGLQRRPGVSNNADAGIGEIVGAALQHLIVVTACQKIRSLLAGDDGCRLDGHPFRQQDDVTGYQTR